MPDGMMRGMADEVLDGDADALRSELAEVEREIDELDRQKQRWVRRVGRFHLRQVRIGLRIIGVFYSVAAIAGVVLIVLGENDLGIPLLVGALFGFGAFVGQGFGMAFTSVTWLRDFAWGQEDRERFRKLGDRYEVLSERLEALENHPDSDARRTR